MGEVVSFKNEIDELQVQYDILSPFDYIGKDERKKDINERIDELDIFLEKNRSLVNDVNSEIDRLTNHADGVDYTVAVACGVVAGLVDVFFVGEFDFEGSYEQINKKFDDIVEKKAKQVEEKEKEQRIAKAINDAKEKAAKKGETISDDKIAQIKKSLENSYKDKHDLKKKLEETIKKLEEKGEVVDSQKREELIEQIKNKDKADLIKKLEESFGIPSDGVYNVAGNGIDSKSHHLDDLAHHPTIIGWAASILTQFTGNAYFQNKDGINIKYKAKKIKIVENVNAYIEYGDSEVIEVISTSGKSRKVLQVTLIGDDLKSKLACGTFNWIGHLLSDIAGSQSSARKGNAGMGLPGPVLSTLKEFAMLPLIKKTPLPQLLNDLFTRDDALFGKYRMDLRSELAIGKELGKQAIPLFLNEIMVRSFYFIRRLTAEIKAANSLKDICWKNTLPFKNRTITRMLTISLGTFEAIDLGDAAIRGAINSGGTLPGFFASFVLRVNFVGIGRFAIACGSDISMGVQREKQRNDRIQLINQQIYLLEAKVYYRQESMWVSAENAVEATDELCNYVEEVIPKLIEANNEVLDGLRNMVASATNLAKSNPEWANRMKKRLRR